MKKLGYCNTDEFQKCLEFEEIIKLTKEEAEIKTRVSSMKHQRPYSEK